MKNAKYLMALALALTTSVVCQAEEQPQDNLSNSTLKMDNTSKSTWKMDGSRIKDLGTKIKKGAASMGLDGSRLAKAKDTVKDTFDGRRVKALLSSFQKTIEKGVKKIKAMGSKDDYKKKAKEIFEDINSDLNKNLGGNNESSTMQSTLKTFYEDMKKNLNIVLRTGNKSDFENFLDDINAKLIKIYQNIEMKYSENIK